MVKLEKGRINLGYKDLITWGGIIGAFLIYGNNAENRFNALEDKCRVLDVVNIEVFYQQFQDLTKDVEQINKKTDETHSSINRIRGYLERGSN